MISCGAWVLTFLTLCITHTFLRECELPRKSFRTLRKGRPPSLNCQNARKVAARRNAIDPLPITARETFGESDRHFGCSRVRNPYFANLFDPIFARGTSYGGRGSQNWSEKKLKKKHGLKKFDPITQAKLLVYGRIQNAIVLGVDLGSKRFKRFEVSQVRFLLLGILPCTFFIFVWEAVYGRNKTFSAFLELLRCYRKPSWGKGHCQA